MNSEKKLIERTIEIYFDGWMTGDTSKIGKVMHQTCHLKMIRDEKFMDLDKNAYLSRFKPKVKELGVGGKIISIDITENIASAKCELETPEFLFTDYFNLLKIDEFWYIMDKVSTRKSKLK